ADMAARYNGLPSLVDSDSAFAKPASLSRDSILKLMAPIFAKWNYKHGLALVHRHCEIKPEEIMLATGDVCQPANVSKAGEFYPERWLSNGKPYEFTTRPTVPPLAELLAEFLPLAKAAGLEDVLGIYHIDEGSKPGGAGGL
ncbi:hypothetical protein BU26DRAFT_443044, partial [Trematosphaeria pertusa]